MQATYSPEDNKLRLYPVSRLDAETYQRVKAAGFIWAPKQGLFVAPAWSPSREDLLLEMCGEIGDEDTSLVDRAEDRAERFGDYSESRAEDAENARKAVNAIADNIPFGQPILVGHHSEKHARRDAEKIENGMRRAVKMWETSEYWKQRAAGAIRHAKYKELPAVRARRIKGLEADQRKQQKERDQAERFIKLWATLHDDGAAAITRKDGGPNTFLDRARYLANYDHVGVVRQDGEAYFCWSAWDVLKPDGERYQACPSWTPEQVQAKVIEVHKAAIARCDRWLSHLSNRLEYERAMLAESGGTASDKTKPEVGGAVRCWASPGHGQGWAYIRKVNKVSVSIGDDPGYGTRVYVRTMPFDKLTAVMSKAEVEAAKLAGNIRQTEDGRGFFYFGGDDPAPQPPKREEIQPNDFDAMRDSLKAGVQVVAAPQLFPTPDGLAARMVELAEIATGHRVLEPSAGTGAILKAIGNGPDKVAVEINPSLVEHLARCGVSGLRIHQGDFLECNGNLGKFDRVLMNPPFQNADDIKHINHALGFLNPGGVLVAICANGPRQQEKLRPLAESWEPLEAGTFAGTGVNAALLVIRK